jgi:GTP-binding protein
MKIPLVAIVGLPNAGKSTMFNKILERRKALTHHEAGTTRDRHYGLTAWNGLGFYLVDTAGIVQRPDSPLEKNVQKQTEIAIEEADMIILVVDGKTPVGNKDLAIASKLVRSGKPVALAANKIDNRSPRVTAEASEYIRLGLGEPILISSANGTGLGDLLDVVAKELKKDFSEPAEEDPDRLKLAFVGKPNVGKSSLINKFLKQDRLLVDSKAGTTRSTVDIPFEYTGKGGSKDKYVLLDTAGVKKKWKQDVDVEAAAAMQSLRTIPKVDVALFVIDCSQEMTFQDQVIAEEIIEQHKSIVLVLNKIDLLSEKERDQYLDDLPNYLPQLWWCPVVFTSAVNGDGLTKVLELAKSAHASASKQIEVAELDAFLEKTIKEHKPGKMDDQRAPKFYNLKQVGVRPPYFTMTVNFPAAIAPAWKKFFEKHFRLTFGYEGTPIVIKYLRRS